MIVIFIGVKIRIHLGYIYFLLIPSPFLLILACGRFWIHFSLNFLLWFHQMLICSKRHGCTTESFFWTIRFIKGGPKGDSFESWFSVSPQSGAIILLKNSTSVRSERITSELSEKLTHTIHGIFLTAING